MGLAKDMFFGSRQAAYYLGVSPRHICRLSRQGRMHAFKVNRDWVIPREEIARWLKRPKLKAGRPRKIHIG